MLPIAPHTKGEMPPLVRAVDDCRATCARLREQGVEITQEPIARYGKVDASFRDRSCNGWAITEVAA